MIRRVAVVVPSDAADEVRARFAALPDVESLADVKMPQAETRLWRPLAKKWRFSRSASPVRPILLATPVPIKGVNTPVDAPIPAHREAVAKCPTNSRVPGSCRASGVVASTSTTPATLSGLRPANSRRRRPPIEWPTMT